MLEDPALEDVVLEDPVLGEPVFVDAGADESLLLEPEVPALEAEVLAVEPLPPPPPQAANKLAIAKPISVFLFTSFFPSRPVQNDC